MFTEQTCYIVTCDECKAPLESDFEGLRYFEDWTPALDAATDSGWTYWQGSLWCASCGIPGCTCGDIFGEHDEGEGACEECPCPAYIPTVRPAK